VAPGPDRQRIAGFLFVVTAAVLVVTGVVLALVFSRHEQTSEKKPGLGVLPTAPATVPPTTSGSSSTPASRARGVWPVGVTAWTVVIATIEKRGHPRAVAERRAHAVRALGLVPHVLDSSLHPRLRRGLWIVFAGRFSTRARALRAARQLQAAGATRAVVERLTG
jgi:SPOR domain